MRKILNLLVGFCLAITSHSQTLTVSGKVVDQSGQPIPFVSIQERSTQRGTVTNSDGLFPLQ